MVKTGFILPQWLILLAIALPLVPLFIIVFRRLWHNAVLNILLGICLLSFVHHVLFQFPSLVPVDQLYTAVLFRQLQFLLLFFLFRSTLQIYWIKQLLLFILVAYLSASITAYLLQPAAAIDYPFSILEAAMLVIMSLMALLQLIRQEYLFIFQSPVFWIAGGTLSYFGMFLMIQASVNAGWLGIPDMAQDAAYILEWFFKLIQYLFYIIAAAATSTRKSDRQIPLF